MDFRFLHTADIHLDSPLRGLSSYEGAPVDRFRSATREAFRNLVTYAIENEVAFIVVAGDLYDGDWPDFSTGLFLVKELERLKKANIKAFILFGNHDAESKLTKSLPWPDNAYRFDHKEPETHILEDLKVALHGQSFARMDVSENLATNYPAPTPGHLNIGVLHTALEGNARHANYAPCSLEELRNHGYDYWALGHVHSHAILCKNPWVTFPGNLQGRHIRETGAKGCILVSVQDGKIADVKHEILDVVRWIDVCVDVVDCPNLPMVSDKCAEAIRSALAQEADSKPAAVRVRLKGETPLHGELIAAFDQLEANLQAATLGMDACWLEAVKIDTTPAVSASSSDTAEAGDMLASLLADASSDECLSKSLEDVLTPVLQRLPHDVGGHTNEAGLEDNPLLAFAKQKEFSKLIASVLPDVHSIRSME